MTASATGLCPRHESQRRSASDKRRGSSRARSYTSRWDRRSREFLAKNPLCARHLVLGDLVTATVADHLENRRALVARGVQDPDADEFLVPLCGPCHSECTAKFEGGFGRQVNIEAKLQWLRGGVT